MSVQLLRSSKHDPLHPLRNTLECGHAILEFSFHLHFLLSGDEIHVYSVMEKVGEGAFATIYLAACLDALDMTDLDGDFRRVALKVQHPPCPWEMYVIRELHARLSRIPSQIDVVSCKPNVKL